MKTSRVQGICADISDVPSKAGGTAGVPGVLSREALLFLAKQRHALALTAAAAEQQVAGLGSAGSASAVAASSQQQQLQSFAAAAAPATAVRWPSRTSGTAGAFHNTVQPEPAAAGLLAAFTHAGLAAPVHVETIFSARRLAALPLQWGSGEVAAPQVAANQQLQLSLLVQQQLMMRQAHHQQQQHPSKWLYQHQLQQHQLQQVLPVQLRQQHTAALVASPNQWQVHAVGANTAHSQRSQHTDRTSQRYSVDPPLVNCTTAESVIQQTQRYSFAHAVSNRTVAGSSSRQRVAATSWPSGLQLAAAEQEQPLPQLQQQARQSAAAAAQTPAAVPSCPSAAAAVVVGTTATNIRLSWGQHRKRSVAVRRQRQLRSSSSSSALDQVVPAVKQRSGHPGAYVRCSSMGSGSPSSSSMQTDIATEEFNQQHLPAEPQQEYCQKGRHVLQQEGNNQQQSSAAKTGCAQLQLQAEQEHALGSHELGATSFSLQAADCGLAAAAMASVFDTGAAVVDDWSAAAASISGKFVPKGPAGRSLALHEQQPVRQQQHLPPDTAAGTVNAVHNIGFQCSVEHLSAPPAAAAATAVGPYSKEPRQVQKETFESEAVTGAVMESNDLSWPAQCPAIHSSTGQEVIAAGGKFKPGCAAQHHQGQILSVPAAVAEGCLTDGWVKRDKRNPRAFDGRDRTPLWQQQANISNQDHQHQHHAAALAAGSALQPGHRQQRTQEEDWRPSATAEVGGSWPKSLGMLGKSSSSDRHVLHTRTTDLLARAREGTPVLVNAFLAASPEAAGAGAGGASSEQHFSWVQQLQPPAQDFSLPAQWRQRSSDSTHNISDALGSDQVVTLTVDAAGGDSGAGDDSVAVSVVVSGAAAAARVAASPSSPGRSKPASSCTAGSSISHNKVIQQQQIERLAPQWEAGQVKQMQHAVRVHAGVGDVDDLSLQQQHVLPGCQLQVAQQALQSWSHAGPCTLQNLAPVPDTLVTHHQQQQQDAEEKAMVLAAVAKSVCSPLHQHKQKQQAAGKLPLSMSSRPAAVSAQQQRQACALAQNPERRTAALGAGADGGQQTAAVQGNGAAVAATTSTGTVTGGAAARFTAASAAKDQLRVSSVMQPAGAVGGAGGNMLPAGVFGANTASATATAHDALQRIAAQQSSGTSASNTAETVVAAAAAPFGGSECTPLGDAGTSRNFEAQPAKNYKKIAGDAAATATNPSSKSVRRPAIGPAVSTAATATAVATVVGVPAMMSQVAMWHPGTSAATSTQHMRSGALVASEVAQQRNWDAAAATAAHQCKWDCMGSGAVLQQYCSAMSAAAGWHAGPAASPSAGSMHAQRSTHSTVTGSKRPAHLSAVAALDSSKRQRVLDLRHGANTAASGAQQLHEQKLPAPAAATTSAWCWRWNAATGDYETMYDKAHLKQRQQWMQTLCSQKQWQPSTSVLGQQQQQQPPARMRPWQQQVQLAGQRSQQERRKLQQLQREQWQEEGYQHTLGLQTARQRRQQPQGVRLIQGELDQWNLMLTEQQHRWQCNRQLLSALDVWSDNGEGRYAGWRQTATMGAAAVAECNAAACIALGGGLREPAVECSSCSFEMDPGHSLPAKDAQPGDYKRREANSRWDADEYELAAVSGAVMLGISLTPLGQNMGECRDPCLMSDLAAAATRAAKRAAAGLPAAALTAEVGVLLMAHEKGVSSAAAWEAWEQCHDGKVVVLVHVKQGVVLSSALPGDEWLGPRLLATRVKSQWGDISLTAGVLSAVAEMLQRCPNLQHIALVSGQDVPVAALPLPLPSGVSMFGSFQFGRFYDAAAQRVAAAQLHQQLGMSAAEAGEWGDSLTFHHTWMILSRLLLLALLTKKQEILQVGQVLNARFMQPDSAVAADEFMLITAAIKYGYSRVVIRSKLQNYIVAVRRQQKQQEMQMEFGEQDEQRRNKLLAAIPGSGCSSEDEEPYASAEELFMAIQAGAAAAALKRQETAETGNVSDSWLSANTSRPTRRRTAALLQQQGSSSSSSSSTTTVAATAAALPPRHPGPPGFNAAAAGSSGQRCGQSVRQVTRSLAAILRDKVAADEATRELAESGDLHHGVLLDCCPTLALFHPTKTRHPHTWRNFSQVYECDLNAVGEEDDNRLNLLQALGLVKPNQALFFRKVDVQHCRGSGKQNADDHLLAVLQLMWQGRPLPESVAALEAV